MVGSAHRRILLPVGAPLHRILGPVVGPAETLKNVQGGRSAGTVGNDVDDDLDPSSCDIGAIDTHGDQRIRTLLTLCRARGQGDSEPFPGPDSRPGLAAGSGSFDTSEAPASGPSIPVTGRAVVIANLSSIDHARDDSLIRESTTRGSSTSMTARWDTVIGSTRDRRPGNRCPRTIDS